MDDDNDCSFKLQSLIGDLRSLKDRFGGHWDSPNLINAMAFELTLIGNSLREINGTPSRIKPLIERINTELALREKPSATFGNSRYLSFHEAGLETVQKFYLDAAKEANPLKWLSVMMGCDIDGNVPSKFEMADFYTGVGGAVHSLNQMPVDELDELINGIRREMILMESINALKHGNDSMPESATAADSPPESEANANAEEFLTVLRLYANGLADEKLAEVAAIFRSGEKVGDRLEKMHNVLPIPSTISAPKIGKIFGVSKTAIQNSDWYIKNRKSENDKTIDRRHDVHKQRSKQFQADFQDEGFD